jgi:lipopolysaccharide export system protein LptA
LAVVALLITSGWGTARAELAQTTLGVGRGPHKGPRSLQLSAETLEYKTLSTGCSKAGRCPSNLVLSGAVTVRSGALQLRTKRLVVSVDRDGKPLTARASGGVTLRLEQGAGRADTARLLLSKWHLELRGHAQLHRPDVGFQVSGQRIAIDLQTGGVVVARASARISARAEGR